MFNKAKDLLTQKQEKLDELIKVSGNAVDMITSTISTLTDVNDEIDKTLIEVEDIKSHFSEVSKGLELKKNHNAKIISKFRNFLED